MEGFPDGLMAISESNEKPRIVVPKDEVDKLIINTHNDILHQGHNKVHHILKPLFFWPRMDIRIKEVVTACETCIKAIQRRRHMKSVFDSQGPAATLLPRQGYGMDFYGVKIGKTQGEILVIVDLATRETILRYLPDQTQDRVVKALLHSVFYPRGVPLFMRSDNAPQLMQGAARDMCTYLGIDQIVTGGHNPRGNSICERVNQTLGSMIRKMSDEDYKNLKDLLPALEHAINVTCNSAIGCTPFEAGHGLAARSIAEARLSLKGARGTDPDSLEDVNSVFDESKIKLQVELAARVLEDARAISEWHRRMTSRKLNQSGQEIDLKAMKVGAEAYFYKPPTIQDVERLGRKAKHIDGDAHGRAPFFRPVITFLPSHHRNKVDRFINRRGIIGLVGFAVTPLLIRAPLGRFRVGLMAEIPAHENFKNTKTSKTSQISLGPREKLLGRAGLVL